MLDWLIPSAIINFNKLAPPAGRFRLTADIPFVTMNRVPIRELGANP
jgi:hypothetical protein